MRKALIAPEKPTKEELFILENYWYLPDWQFEALVGHKCTELSIDFIYRESKEPTFAITYGLKAIKAESGKPCVANFFVHFEDRVYQCKEMISAVMIPKLLRKHYEYNEYEMAIWRQKQGMKALKSTKAA